MLRPKKAIIRLYKKKYIRGVHLYSYVNPMKVLMGQNRQLVVNRIFATNRHNPILIKYFINITNIC